MSEIYKGVIVEEALDDNRLINSFKILKVHITDHAAPEDRWHMYEVETDIEQIKSIAPHIIKNWYIHFWNGTHLISLFKDKIFEFDCNDRDTWKPVTEHGLSIGVPQHELDFPTKGL